MTEVCLAEIAAITSGRRPPEVEKMSTNRLTVPVIGGGGPSGFTSAALYDGNILITGRVGTLGKLFVPDRPCWPSDNALVIFPKDAGTDFRFLRYALQMTIADAAGMNRGAANPLITQKDLGTLKLHHPSLPDQLAIASILGSLDDKIELNRRMNETLEDMARALFKDWFIDFGPTRAKMEGRAPYLAPAIWSLFPESLDDEGKPEGWQARPVGDFAELRGGKQLEKTRISTKGTIPVFGGAGVMGFTDGHNADGFVISVGRVGAYCGQFFSHRGKAWINNNASLIRPLGSVSAEWLFQSLRHADIEVIKKGAAQPFVSNTDIANMPVMWPGENIVLRFTEILVPMMLKIEQNNEEASTLAATRDLLLPKLMSGEVRVKDAENLIGEAT